MRRIYRTFILTVIFITAILTKNFNYCNADEKVCTYEDIIEPEIYEQSEKEITEFVGKEREEIKFTEEEIALIALVTMAEAEGECEEGKRLVIDTVLNRVDSIYYPQTVYEVIYQPNQFSSIWNGRVDRCDVREDICEIVREEMISRTNYEVIFFTAGGYGIYGTPMFQIENHYFSSYN